MSDPVILSISGSAFQGWQDLEITRSIDSFSAVGFSAPFEPSRRDFRDLFRPFSFRDVGVSLAGRAVFSGTMVDVTPDVKPDAARVSVSAYSKAAVLGDCHAPSSEYPLEFRGMNLLQIAQRLARPFGVSVTSEDDTGAAFDKVAIEPQEEIFKFLSELAKQRSMVLGDSPDGGLVLRRSVTGGTSVVDFREGAPPLAGVSPRFSPQGYYSEITAHVPTRAGREGAKYTAKNTKLTDSLRPHSFKVDDADKGDIERAAKAKLGRMFGNVVSYSIEVPTWYDPSGDLWEPNTVVTLAAPGAMVYNRTTLVVRKVTFRRTSEEDSATLDLVLPGAFSGAIPDRLPWEE